MKTIIIAGFFLLLSSGVFSQDIVIDFQAKYKSTVTTGKAWNFEYFEMKNPVNIKYSGEELSLIDTSGKQVMKVKINRAYQTKRSSDRTFYTLEYQENGLTGYIVFEEYSELGETTRELQLPTIDDTGKVTGYTYYSTNS